MKSFKVDNWGGFLQKQLHSFFQMTDFCDLILQFSDNSQLKVHQVLLNTCTDYFNNNIKNNILIINDLQVDVVVPIVNFIYTGTLEFDYRIYDRLYFAAKHMKIEILLTLLQAYKNENLKNPIVKSTLSQSYSTREDLKKGAKLETNKQIPVSKNCNGLIEMASETMLALLAKGAENMTGPWLCLRCGVDGQPINIKNYPCFRRHLIQVHHEKIDKSLCENCGYKSKTKADLTNHLFIEHNIKPFTNTMQIKCSLCNYVAVNSATLKIHCATNHGSKIKPSIQENQHCIFCNKVFADEMVLYEHIRSNHNENGRKDEKVDAKEQLFIGADEVQPIAPLKNPSTAKIEIISNVRFPSTTAVTKMPGLIKSKNKKPISRDEILKLKLPEYKVLIKQQLSTIKSDNLKNNEGLEYLADLDECEDDYRDLISVGTFVENSESNVQHKNSQLQSENSTAIENHDSDKNNQNFADAFKSFVKKELKTSDKEPLFKKNDSLIKNHIDEGVIYEQDNNYNHNLNDYTHDENIIYEEYCLEDCEFLEEVILTGYDEST